MNTQTSLVAEQVRLQQWAEQIKECQNRPSDMKVAVFFASLFCINLQKVFVGCCTYIL